MVIIEPRPETARLNHFVHGRLDIGKVIELSFWPDAGPPALRVDLANREATLCAKLQGEEN